MIAVGAIISCAIRLASEHCRVSLACHERILRLRAQHHIHFLTSRNKLLGEDEERRCAHTASNEQDALALRDLPTVAHGPDDIESERRFKLRKMIGAIAHALIEHAHSASVRINLIDRERTAQDMIVHAWDLDMDELPWLHASRHIGRFDIEYEEGVGELPVSAHRAASLKSFAHTSSSLRIYE